MYREDVARRIIVTNVCMRCFAFCGSVAVARWRGMDKLAGVDIAGLDNVGISLDGRSEFHRLSSH